MLDHEFANLLSENVQNSILKTLKKTFDLQSLSINITTLTTATLAKKETQAKALKTTAIEQDFLNNVGVEKLQQVFQAKVDLTSIKENP